MQASY